MKKTAITLCLAAIGVMTFGPATAQPVINEVVINHVGADTNEYYEIFGIPNTNYSNLTIVEIEGDSPATGLIDDATFAVGSTDGAGYWCNTYQNNIIENGTVTILLVSGYTGAVNQDIDTNDDGVIDVTPWTAIIDAVAISDGGATDRTYAGAVDLSPNYDGGGFTVGAASRIPNGIDTNANADWVRNDFDGFGLPAFPGTLAPGEAINTPCAFNTTDPATSTTTSTFGRIKILYR